MAITPHKGGRTERLYLRVTPEDKARIEKLAEAMNISVADLVIQSVSALEEKLPTCGMCGENIIYDGYHLCDDCRWGD